MTSIKWDELTMIEPRLIVLEQIIKGYHKPARTYEVFCANRLWYGFGEDGIIVTGIKQRLMKLVGTFADNKFLNTTEAYDVAYQHLYEQMPACKSCACL